MDNVVDYIKKSFELKNQGYYKQAIEMLYKALSIENDNLEILAQLAHLYRLLNNFQRAVYYIEKVLDVDKTHLDCLLLLMDVYIAEQSLNEACDVAERIYAIRPTPENLAEKIKLLNQLHQLDKIIELENSEEDFSDVVLYEIAVAYFDSNNKQKSLQVLEKGLGKNDKNEKILLLLAKIYYEKNEHEKSKQIFFYTKK